MCDEIYKMITEVPDTFRDSIELETLLYSSRTLEDKREMVMSLSYKGGYEPGDIVDLFREFYQEVYVNTLAHFTKQERQNGYWALSFIKDGTIQNELTVEDLIGDESTRDWLNYHVNPVAEKGLIDFLESK